MNTTQEIVLKWLAIRKNYDKIPIMEVPTTNANSLCCFAAAYDVGYEDTVYALNENYFRIHIID